MKCEACGAELKEGCLYCSVCGHESKVGTEYSGLEDDFLSSIIVKGDGAGDNSAPYGDNAGMSEDDETRLISRGSTREAAIEGTYSGQTDGQGHMASPVAKGNDTKPVRTHATGMRRLSEKQRQSRYLKTFIACIAAAVVIAIIVAVAVRSSVAKKHDSSFEYQVEQAEMAVSDGDLETALTYYGHAANLDEEDVDVRLAMADIYMQQDDEDSAIALYKDVIGIDASNVAAYQALVDIYDGRGDYNAIIALMPSGGSDEVMALFADYLVDAPMISPESGDYDDYVTANLFSPDWYDIYYTLDGTDPDASNGILYEGEDIEFKEAGTHELKAVCRNEKGIYSDIASAIFVIEFMTPSYAVVTPDGGHFDEETFVTITAESDCAIFYTWDGTDPTRDSEQYVEPLEVPAGNNVLSVLVINYKSGLSSGVYRTNFVYYP